MAALGLDCRVVVRADAAAHHAQIVAFLVRRTRHSYQAATAVAIALSFPIALPYTWRTAQMDNHFRIATEPVPGDILRLTDWIRRESDGVFLVAGDLFQ